MKTIFALSEQTRQETQGYFDIRHNGVADPSGIVKGWAILQAATMLKAAGFMHFYIDAGGDIQVAGNKGGNAWRIGIRNPFNRNEIVKVLSITDKGIATSGTAIRGQHIYDPHNPHRGRPLAPIHTANAASAASASHSSSVKGEGSPPHFHTSPAPTDIVSLTVIGPNVYEADRFATAAFAMGKKGIYFIEQLQGFEGYMIDASARATFTSGFERYVLQHDNTH
jgi:thiamine biosynthesis lipoprotein